MVTFQKTNESNESQPITHAVGRHCCSAVIFVFDVGYVIGKSFEQQMRSANATCAESFSHCGSSHSVRPHVRRAHWHHYWVGEGRNRLEVRWIEPTLVLANSKNEADVAIVRSVKGA